MALMARTVSLEGRVGEHVLSECLSEEVPCGYVHTWPESPGRVSNQQPQTAVFAGYRLAPAQYSTPWQTLLRQQPHVGGYQ
jgi:hypothetical protein